MKVGIFTFYSNNNYGSSLQSYALLSAIEDLGYEACVIDYADYSRAYNKKLHSRTIFNRFFSCILYPNEIVGMIKGKLISRNVVVRRSNSVKELYALFADKYLHLYKEDYTKKQNEFQSFVCGSDQVWKVAVPGLHEVLFLRFTDKQKRVAYAVSLGGENIPKCNKNRFKRYVKEFYAIGVRESQTIPLLQKVTGITPKLVLDPVLLKGCQFWENIIQKEVQHTTLKEKYVLCYFLDAPKKLTGILDFCSKNKLKAIWIDGGILPNQCGFSIITPSPFEFVEYIYNANLVITDSFHATAFSIMFEKDFWTVKRNYSIYSGQHVRIESLLSLCGLEQRLLKEYTSIPCEKIDESLREQIRDVISSLREESIKFLSKSISRV